MRTSSRFFFSMPRPPPSSTLFPYTTLFRSRKGSERIVRYAFDLARRLGRKKVTVVHKANILKSTSGLFLKVARSEEHTSELQSRRDLVCRLLLEKKKKNSVYATATSSTLQS